MVSSSCTIDEIGPEERMLVKYSGGIHYTDCFLIQTHRNMYGKLKNKLKELQCGIA